MRADATKNSHTSLSSNTVVSIDTAPSSDATKGANTTLSTNAAPSNDGRHPWDKLSSP
jgi:hypothetical protein